MLTHFIKGRGSLSNPSSRFQAYSREPWLDESSGSVSYAPGVEDSCLFEAPSGTGLEGVHASGAHASGVQAVIQRQRPATTVTKEHARSIITRNQSPDIPFDRSINAYRGCEHGCIYCYARPSHAYLDLSPGLDFETRLYAKENAAEVLRKEFSRPGYTPARIAMGTNTDPYQPVERRLGITAQLLEVFDEFNHPVTLTTKSALITRDLSVLSRLARRNLVQVHLSVGTLNREVARRMEPRASTPAARIEALRELRKAGIPAGVIIAPIIPALTDHDLERVAIAASEAGAIDATYILLRLPHEVSPLFQEWLHEHYPMKAAHVMNLLRSMRGGRDYHARFGERMRGTGTYATMLQQRFERITARLGLNRRQIELDTSAFRRPTATNPVRHQKVHPSAGSPGSHPTGTGRAPTVIARPLPPAASSSNVQLGLF